MNKIWIVYIFNIIRNDVHSFISNFNLIWIYVQRWHASSHTCIGHSEHCPLYKKNEKRFRCSACFALIIPNAKWLGNKSTPHSNHHSYCIWYFNLNKTERQIAFVNSIRIRSSTWDFYFVAVIIRFNEYFICIRRQFVRSSFSSFVFPFLFFSRIVLFHYKS